jgi:toxin CcdB
MARFDVYEISGGRGYLLDVQSNLLSGLNTRVVVPLLPLAQAPRPARRLNPVFEIGRNQFAMVTQFMASIPQAELQVKAGSLDQRHDEIMNALDMIFTGA